MSPARHRALSPKAERPTLEEGAALAGGPVVISPPVLGRALDRLRSIERQRAAAVRRLRRRGMVTAIGGHQSFSREVNAVVVLGLLIVIGVVLWATGHMIVH